ncbi:hypothetical protein [Streptomyces sp. ISL-86]|uniref:hypothetical protein n=1 Tax=Streptomyces sp. ISL-86 TaxID=2819187 RepID=UPI001BEA3C1C|nr:hypothetical protein [Streptomyces sp. ISL-86]MBT2453291.1 hypothetical protein [Streptomyces sp. ISL-86]
MTDSPARTYAERLAAASPVAAAALALGGLAEPSDRKAQIVQLGDRAGLVLVHSPDDFDPHFARPDSGTAVCAQQVYRVLNAEQAARVSVLCTACERAAEAIGRARIDEMRQAANEASARVRTDPNPDDPEWQAALERLTVTLAFLSKHDPVTSEAINSAAQKIADELAPAKPTEGDVLIAELAKLGRRAYLGGEGGVSYLIMAVDPDAPDDPTFPYGHPHVLMYAGEQADRRASQHREPWSAHLHGADGDYVATIGANFSGRLDAAADAARCAREVDQWLRAFHGTPAA